MVTRGSTLAGRHVEALNAIDVDFYGDRKVVAAWKLYFDHLCQSPPATDAWERDRENLLVDLLYEMAKSLDYDFDKATIKRNRYSPIAHGQLENDLNVIRKGFVDVIGGTKRFPVDVTFSDTQKAQTPPKDS